jgi:hypothetical protein
MSDRPLNSLALEADIPLRALAVPLMRLSQRMGAGVRRASERRVAAATVASDHPGVIADFERACRTSDRCFQSSLAYIGAIGVRFGAAVQN